MHLWSRFFYQFGCYLHLHRTELNKPENSEPWASECVPFNIAHLNRWIICTETQTGFNKSLRRNGKILDGAKVKRATAIFLVLAAKSHFRLHSGDMRWQEEKRENAAAIKKFMILCALRILDTTHNTWKMHVPGGFLLANLLLMWTVNFQVNEMWLKICKFPLPLPRWTRLSSLDDNQTGDTIRISTKTQISILSNHNEEIIMISICCELLNCLFIASLIVDFHSTHFNLIIHFHTECNPTEIRVGNYSSNRSVERWEVFHIVSFSFSSIAFLSSEDDSIKD